MENPKCTACGSPCAYIGMFGPVDCVSRTCQFARIESKKELEPGYAQVGPFVLPVCTPEEDAAWKLAVGPDNGVPSTNHEGESGDESPASAFHCEPGGEHLQYSPQFCRKISKTQEGMREALLLDPSSGSTYIVVTSSPGPLPFEHISRERMFQMLEGLERLEKHYARLWHQAMTVALNAKDAQMIEFLYAQGAFPEVEKAVRENSRALHGNTRDRG